MGKQGHGIGKGKPRQADRGFGTALIKQQQSGVQGMKISIFLNDSCGVGVVAQVLKDMGQFFDILECSSLNFDSPSFSSTPPTLAPQSFSSALNLIGLNGLNHYADVVVQKTLMSNLHSTDINEYMEGLDLEGREVDVRRVKSDADAAFLVEGTSISTTVQSMTNQSFDYEHLPVPRKPEWNKKMNAAEVSELACACACAWVGLGQAGAL